MAMAIGGTFLAYARDMRATRERLIAGSRVVQTRHGHLEYAVRGGGPPVLVVHGAGGGHDQGLLLAQAFGRDGFRWIIPSRFGYLRSALPADASTIAQAEAFVDLLDSLGIERIALLAMSGGVPPALQFAARHPERTSALVLLSSAPYTPLGVANQKLPMPSWAYHALFSSDFPYWVLQKVARNQLARIFDVTPALQTKLTRKEETLVQGMIDSFQPVTSRIGGIRNEGAAIEAGAAYPLRAIRSPALVIHAADDRINSYSVGTHTAAHIHGSEFVPLASGGHLLLGHHAEIQARVNAFFKQHVDSIRQARAFGPSRVDVPRGR